MDTPIYGNSHRSSFLQKAKGLPQKLNPKPELLLKMLISFLRARAPRIWII